MNIVDEIASTIHLERCGPSDSTCIPCTRAAVAVANMFTVREEDEHPYRVSGNWVMRGSSMDPHRCGDPDEPCMRVRRYILTSEYKKL